jgi:hypothetical protein
MFDIDMRYFSLTMLHIDLKLFDGVQDCMLELNVDHLPADVRRFFIERDLAAIVSMVGVFAYDVVERYADKVTAEVSLDKEVLNPLLTLVPVENIAFDRPHTRLHFPRAMFDEPLPQAPAVQCRPHRRGGVKAVGLHRHLDILPRLQALARRAAERVSACLGLRPSTVGLGGVDLALPGLSHAPRFDEALHPFDIGRRPRTARLTAAESLDARHLVVLACQAVDPTETQRDFDGLAVGHARLRRVFVEQPQPDLRRLIVVARQPVFPFVRRADV